MRMADVNKAVERIKSSSGNTTVYTATERSFVDASTGEVVKVNQVRKTYYGTRQFYKLSKPDFCRVLDALASKPAKILAYLLREMNSDNLIMQSQRQIAQRTGCSLDSVRRTFKALEDSKMLFVLGNGRYIISPTILLKGDESKRERLFRQYINPVEQEKPVEDESSMEDNFTANKT